MSTNDLLSSTINWPGKGLYGLKSSVLQTTESDLVKQTIVSDHMRNHYRRLHNARSAVDSKPPKAMVLGQKCRDRARKELAQMVYTQNLLNRFTGGSLQPTPRGRSTQSARSHRIIQSQPTTYRARSRSIESARSITRSATMNGSENGLNNTDIANKFFGSGVIPQALTTMAALGKLTSTTRNKNSADILDKHPDSFFQPNPSEHKPRLVKRESESALRNNRAHYNPPRKVQSRPTTPTKPVQTDENKQKEDQQLALRDQLNRSLEIRQSVEKKIKKAKSTTMKSPVSRKQSDEMLKQFGLAEHERLQYVKFMQNITDAIIRNNLTTESAIERLFEIHIDRNRQTLDEQRMRNLLEALKEDLGVQTSRKNEKYSTVSKATNFDNQPLPPTTKREELIILTPKTPHDSQRRSSYDINDPFPWEINNETEKNISNQNSNNLFSPSSTTIQAKPRLSLQTKTDVNHRINENRKISENQTTNPMNFNSTIRKPMTNLQNTNNQEEIYDDHEKSPTPEQIERPQSNSYETNDFDESDNSDQ